MVVKELMICFRMEQLVRMVSGKKSVIHVHLSFVQCDFEKLLEISLHCFPLCLLHLEFVTLWMNVFDAVLE